MSYRRVTIISGSPVTDEMIADMKNKWMPPSLGFGVTKWEAVQSGPESVFIIATYPDKATADAGADKAAAVRAQTQEEYRDLVPTILQGEVIVSN